MNFRPHLAQNTITTNRQKKSVAPTLFLAYHNNKVSMKVNC